MRRKYDYHIHFQLKFVFINMNMKNQRGTGEEQGEVGEWKKTRKHMKKPQWMFRPPWSGNSERARELLLPSDCDVLCHGTAVWGNVPSVDGGD